jgi:hypothetical protein
MIRIMITGKDWLSFDDATQLNLLCLCESIGINCEEMSPGKFRSASQSDVYLVVPERRIQQVKEILLTNGISLLDPRSN